MAGVPPPPCPRQPVAVTRRRRVNLPPGQLPLDEEELLDLLTRAQAAISDEQPGAARRALGVLHERAVPALDRLLQAAALRSRLRKVVVFVVIDDENGRGRVDRRLRNGRNGARKPFFGSSRQRRLRAGGLRTAWRKGRRRKRPGDTRLCPSWA